MSYGMGEKRITATNRKWVEVFSKLGLFHCFVFMWGFQMCLGIRDMVGIGSIVSRQMTGRC